MRLKLGSHRWVTNEGYLMMKQLRRAMLVGILALGVVACGGDGETDAAPKAEGGDVEGEVLVFAAASLTDAFGDIKTAFEEDNPDAEVQLNFSGSSALREQILSGAPADVFASANESNMADVVDADEVAGEPQIFVTNELQIAVPAGNPGKVKGLDDFANDDLLIGLCAVEVPCGDFAREALEGVGVEPAIDTNEPDVRALLTKIGSDELDAGIVYVTDVTSAGDRVEGIDIPADDNVVAKYPIAQLAGAPNGDGAKSFKEFVLSGEGQQILTGYGFGTP
jgi:molybdate transport system substrate-binding protein